MIFLWEWKLFFTITIYFHYILLYLFILLIFKKKLNYSITKFQPNMSMEITFSDIIFLGMWFLGMENYTLKQTPHVT